jgi:hypothetical protein
LQGLYSQIEMQIQEMGKSVDKGNERVGRKLDDLLNDMEDQLGEVSDKFSSAKKEQIDAIQQSIHSMKEVQNEWNRSFDQLRNELIIESQKQTELVYQSIKEMIEKWEVSQTRFQETISESLSQQQDHFSRLVDKQTLIGLEKRLPDKQQLSVL